MSPKDHTMPKHDLRPEFDWADPFYLSEQLSEEERMVQDTARQYAQGKLMPRIIEANRKGEFDPAIMREMGERPQETRSRYGVGGQIEQRGH